MALAEDSLITREEKIGFIRRSCHPMDSKAKRATRGLENLPDKDLDRLYGIFVKTSIMLRGTLNTAYIENPHLNMVISGLSDARINRLFSSMRAIQRLEWIERFIIAVAIVASLFFLWGLYHKTLLMMFTTVGIGMVDILLIGKLRKKINLLLEDSDLLRVFPVETG